MDVSGLDAVIPILSTRPHCRTDDDTTQLSSWLGRQHGFFAHAGQLATCLLCPLLGHVFVKEGDRVYRQGQIGDCMYILLSGYCAVFKERRPSQLEAQLSSSSRRGTGEQQQWQWQQQQQGWGSLNPSRRGTSEEMGQARPHRQSEVQLKVDMQQVGWLSAGDTLGEAALVNPSDRRLVTVLAGDGGCHLVTLERAAYNRLLQKAGAEVAAERVLAAACWRMLHTAPSSRSAEDVATLAEFMSSLEAFRRLPALVRLKLAKTCQPVRLDPGTVLFQEGAPGDAMFVVMSGRCQIRALPEPAAEPAPDQEAEEGCRQQLQGISGALGRSAVPTAATAAAAGAAAGVGQIRAAPHGAVGSWERGAVTEEEQERLHAVQEALMADDEQNPAGLLKHSAAAEQAEKRVDKDGLYYTAKYMKQAKASATAADPLWGLEGGLTPLAAVFAAQWRNKMRERQAQLLQQGRAAEQESCTADRAFKAMEELVGKAAAKAWREAKEAANSSSAAAAAASASSSSSNSLRARDKEQQQQQPSPGDAEAAGSVGAVAGSSSSCVGADAAWGQHSPAAAAGGAGPEGTCDVLGLRESLQAQTAAQQQPAHAESWALLAEMGSRSQLESVLARVAAAAAAKGLPRRLSRKASLKLTREVNKRMLGGASQRSYATQASGLSAAAGGSHEQQQQQQGQANHEEEDAAVSVSFSRRCSQGHESVASLGACTSAAGTELTGAGPSADWRDSMEGSEGFLSSMGSLDLGASGASEWEVPFRGSRRCSLTDCTHEQRHGQQHQEAEEEQQQGVVEQQDAEALQAKYGAVVRVVEAGGSFGELALLQRGAARTITVLAEPACRQAAAAAASSSSSSDWGLNQAARSAQQREHHHHHHSHQQQQQLATGADPEKSLGTCLIRISRAAFDAAVRSLQVAALEELLGFLAGVPAFAGLKRDQLTALAVFARPLKTAAGQMLAVQGEPVSCLMILQEGEIKLLDGRDAAAATAGSNFASPASLPLVPSSSSRSSPQGLRSRRATADQVLTRGSSTAAGAAGSGLLLRQVTNPGVDKPSSIRFSKPGSGSQDQGWSVAAAAADQCGVGVSLVGPAAGSGAVRSLLAPNQAARLAGAAALAVMGPGSCIGENVMGLDGDVDLPAALAAAAERAARSPHRRSGGGAAAAGPQPPCHCATVVTSKPCTLLVVEACDLERFGRQVRQPLAALAVSRKDLVEARRAELRPGLAAPDLCLSAAPLQVPQQDQQLQQQQRALSRRTTSLSGLHVGLGSNLRRTSSMSNSSLAHEGLPPIRRTSQLVLPPVNGLLTQQQQQQQLPQQRQPAIAARGSEAGLRGGMGAQKRRTGSFGGHALAVLESAVAAAGVPEGILELQQQLQEQQSTCWVKPLTAADVKRWTALVPSGPAVPSLSSLAGASRPFPAGMLSASNYNGGMDGAWGC